VTAFLTNNKFHGFLSLLFILTSLILATVSIVDKSFTIGAVYITIILVSFPTIVYSFCSKCPCRIDSCGHVLPGKLTLLLPSRNQNSYRSLDFIGVIAPFLLLIGIPQWWLLNNTVLLILFWILVILAVIEIRRYVCPRCTNRNCPLCKHVSIVS